MEMESERMLVQHVIICVSCSGEIGERAIAESPLHRAIADTLYFVHLGHCTILSTASLCTNRFHKNIL